MTIAELELLAWAWAVPAENPFIWALTLTLLPAQTPGTRKVPWVPLVAMVPGRVRRETLAPDSGRPDGVTTEPKRMWLGHLQVSELHPRGTWEQQRQRENSWGELCIYVTLLPISSPQVSCPGLK